MVSTSHNAHIEDGVYRHGNCAFSAESLELHVAALRDDAPFNKPEMREFVTAFPVRGRFAHELDHLYRTVGTSWGLMTHIMQGRLLNYYVGILGTTDLRAELAGRRLSEVAQECRRRNDRFEARGRFNGRLHALTREAEARRVLMGFRPFGPLLNLSNTYNRLWGLGAVPNTSEALHPHPPNPDHPGRAITAASVLEGLGILKEAMFDKERGDATDHDVIGSAEPAYTFALSYARSVLANRFNWDVQPVELEAALGLALWPPLTPNGLSEIRSWTWEDVEPGHRYQRIISWLADRGKPLTNHDTLSDVARDELFETFYREACEHFTWPSPSLLAELWIAHLESSTPFSSTANTWWCLGERRIRTMYALNLLREQAAHPYHAWFHVAPTTLGRQPSFGCIGYKDVCEVPEQHCDTDGRTISARIESYVFRGMFVALGYSVRRDSDDHVLAQHLRLMPQFVDPGPEREQAALNCSVLAEDLLRDRHGLDGSSKAD